MLPHIAAWLVFFVVNGVSPLKPHTDQPIPFPTVAACEAAVEKVRREFQWLDATCFPTGPADGDH